MPTGGSKTGTIESRISPILRFRSLDVHYWGNKGTHILNTYNVNQLPDLYLSLGTALNQQVPNPFYGIVTTGLLSQKTISRQQSLVLFPQYQGISNVYAPNASASYNAFTVQVDGRISSGFHSVGQLHLLKGNGQHLYATRHLQSLGRVVVLSVPHSSPGKDQLRLRSAVRPRSCLRQGSSQNRDGPPW